MRKLPEECFREHTFIHILMNYTKIIKEKRIEALVPNQHFL